MAVDRRNGEEPSLDEEQAGEVGGDEMDDICIRIEDRYEKLSRSSDSFIFRVPHQLRQVNESAYEPRIISIGPYHRGKAHLGAMESHKLSYLYMLLERRDGRCLVRYVDAMRLSEYAARRCYAEPLNMSPEEFVEMLVLDGCFVVELICKFASNELRFEGDDPFKLNFNLSIVGQELLLVENQLPFFVLEKLFRMTKRQSEDETFAKMALNFFSGIVPGPGIQIENYCPPSDRPIKHLLGLVHDNWLPSPEPRVTDGKWKCIRSAKDLLEVGIKFKKVSEEKTSSLFDINFQEGRFHIPTLTINHDTERIFRNLIAYEQQFDEGPTYVMDYARFMDCLINHGDDVAMLSHRGIFVHWLGSHEDVARMFNKLNDYVYLSTANFYYSEIFNEVNKYCEKPWTLWKVGLRNKYFHSPWHWVLVSIIAGIILLLLTSVQTAFAVFPYFKQGS